MAATRATSEVERDLEQGARRFAGAALLERLERTLGSLVVRGLLILVHGTFFIVLLIAQARVHPLPPGHRLANESRSTL